MGNCICAGIILIRRVSDHQCIKIVVGTETFGSLVTSPDLERATETVAVGLPGSKYHLFPLVLLHFLDDLI